LRPSAGQPRRDGRLLAPDSAGDWHAAVLGLLQGSGRRAALAAAGRHKVAAEFTIDRMTERYLELYRDVCR